MQVGAKGFGKKGFEETGKGQSFAQNRGYQGCKGFGKKGSYGKGKGGKQGKGWDVHALWEEETWDDSAMFLCSITPEPPVTCAPCHVEEDRDLAQTLHSMPTQECFRNGRLGGRWRCKQVLGKKPTENTTLTANRFAGLEKEDIEYLECESDGIPIMSFMACEARMGSRSRPRGRIMRRSRRRTRSPWGWMRSSLWSPKLLGVDGQPQWKTLEVVVDSGAAESVPPERLAPWVPTRPSRGSARGQTYVSASGDKLPNRREKHLELMTDEGEWARATFQVAEVTRPLCSVSRMCDQGNRVIFGSGGGYVEHIAIGKRSYFQRAHNVYVMHMHVLVGDGGKEHSEGFARQGP